MKNPVVQNDYGNDPEPIFVVYIADRRVEFPPHKFLEACWGDMFDTPCSVCEAGFDIARAPPVRTLRLHSSYKLHNSPFPESLPPLVIANTHLDCLKLKQIKYFPISHAWHYPVADAYEFRVSNPEAAKMVYEMPIRILMGVAQRFGPDTQIWHDYISIPQWQDNFRGAKILPQIFQIFKFGLYSIIHLDEEPAIQTLERYSLEDFTLHSSDLQRLFSSRWFRRMWIVIEYDVCPDAYIMNSNYEIMPNTLSALARQIEDYQDITLRNKLTTSQCPPEESDWQLLGLMPAFLKQKVKVKCLGYIYDMIGNQQCRSHRDRFVAACALLDVDDHLSMISEMPLEPREACSWVSRRCLANNDYSPLLLSPSEEISYDKAQWLRGHTVMAPNMWGLAVQTRAARNTPYLQGSHVYLTLDLMGGVVDHVTWRISGTGSYYGFVEVLPHIVGFAAGCTSTFLDCLERIYPSEFFWAQKDGGTYEFPELRYRPPPREDFGPKLRRLLQLYDTASFKDDKNIARETLTQKFVSLCCLDEPPSVATESFRNVSRLQLYALICTADEYHLVSVHCETCGRKTLVRAALWEGLGDHTKVFGIPGLAYSTSVCDGMAIIVKDGRIIGRVRFGPPACNCNTALSIKLS